MGMFLHLSALISAIVRANSAQYILSNLNLNKNFWVGYYLDRKQDGLPQQLSSIL